MSASIASFPSSQGLSIKPADKTLPIVSSSSSQRVDGKNKQYHTYSVPG